MPATLVWFLSGSAASRSRVLRFLLCGGMLAGAAILPGCNPPSPPTAGTPTAGSPAAVEDPLAQQCAVLIRSLVSTFDFTERGLTSEISAGVSQLNQWVRTCHAELPSEMPQTAAMSRLPPAAMTLVRRSRFSNRDGEHLRDCLLARTVQERVEESGQGDLSRVSDLFDHVMRNVRLVASRPADVPLTPYNLYLLGQGTAEDRAWIFVELVRQLEIDAYLLQLPAGPSDEAAPFLVVVRLEDQTYLFDPRLGLALPALAAEGAGKPAGPSVATLAAALADPAVLAQWNEPEKPSLFQPESLAQAGVLLVGTSSLWAPRMQLLQPSFSGPRAMIIYEDLAAQLADAEKIPGLARSDRVAIWAYPETQSVRAENPSAEQRQVFENLADPWKAHLEPKQQKDNTFILVQTSTHLKARVAQMQGEFETAIASYTNVRLHMIPKEAKVDLGTRRRQERAAEEALYFTGICKFEQGTENDLRIAGDKLRQYLKEFPQGAWAASARYHLGRLLVLEGKPAEAAQLLEEIPAEHPQSAGYRLTARRWRELVQEEASEPSAPAPAAP